MAFIPRPTNNTVVLRRSYETHLGTFTKGHQFTRLPESLSDHVYGLVTLRDSDGREITISQYELDHLT